MILDGLFGSGDIMKKRTAFFAHYDPDGIIADYVVHYIACLYEAGVEVVYFASDSNVSNHEIQKLPAGTRVVGSSRHGEYDFGSWKRCFLAHAQDHGPDGLSKIDELLLCNDSCYGPIQPLIQMFHDMEKRDCDFWGVTQVKHCGGYCPTYFIVVRRRILSDLEFQRFFESVGAFANKAEYCEKYEVGLNRFLTQNKYVRACYLDRYPNLDHTVPQVLTPLIFSEGMPFIRVMLARENPGGIAHLATQLEFICDQYKYPLRFIRDHLQRVAPDFEKGWHCRIQDVDTKVFRIIRIRMKATENRKRVRLRVRIFGIPIIYVVFPMLHTKIKWK
jgi:lipopolysaccharide biosynthesis protein